MDQRIIKPKKPKKKIILFRLEDVGELITIKSNTRQKFQIVHKAGEPFGKIWKDFATYIKESL